jgi:hypothetical protein
MTSEFAKQQRPQIHWYSHTPRPGCHTVTGVTDDARGFLHWMATDGPTPVMGTWDGTSLVIPDGEADYLLTVLGANFTEGLVIDDE